jgi:aryl-alcohol dehydrogenase-like predicted oxidoreductase
VRKRWSQQDIKVRAALVDKLKGLIPPEMNLSQVALAFCLAHPAVTSVIPGNMNLKQLESNLESVQLKLSPETLKDLRAFYRNEVREMQLPW